METSILSASHVLSTLQDIDGFYECPKDSLGKRLGPLVGYAGKYQESDSEKQYVGDVYINFSIAEQYPSTMFRFAEALVDTIPQESKNSIDVVCGPQMGGIAIGQLCALKLGCRFAYIEKQVTQLASPELREQSLLGFLRHTIKAGDKVLLTEDVCNNFSTTKEAIELIESQGATVVCIACLLNRSSEFTESYEYNDKSISVYSLVKKSFTQWRQDDIEVSEDIAQGNVVLKPKSEWARLTKAMAQ